MTAECWELFRKLRAEKRIGPVWPTAGGYMMGVEPMFNLASAEHVQTSAFVEMVYGLSGLAAPRVELDELSRIERFGASSQYSPEWLRRRKMDRFGMGIRRSLHYAA